MDPLFKTFILLACVYVVAGQLNLGVDHEQAIPPLSVVEAMNKVQRDYDTVMADLGSGRQDIGQPEEHLGKILNVIKQLTRAKFLNRVQNKQQYDEVVTLALRASLPVIRKEIQHEMKRVKTVRLNLIQRVIDVSCPGLSPKHCEVAVEKYFYGTVPQMEDDLRKEYEMSLDTLFSLESSFRSLLMPKVYNTMKNYAKDSDSTLYVHYHKKTVDHLVDSWLHTLKQVKPVINTRRMFYG